LTLTLSILSAYLLLVIFIGLASHRLFRGTGEDFFLATRTIGPFILLMSLFGTHMTAFSLLGASAEAYRRGILVFGLMASSSALMVPLVFLFVGTRLWAVGKRLGFQTQVQFFVRRYGSPTLGLVLFMLLVGFLIPYLLIGILGGGVALEQISGGAIPSWVGGLVITGVVGLYVSYGGLRGTSWVNTFQTLVFMTLGALASVLIVRDLGGLSVALEKVAETSPQLLIRGDALSPWTLLTYTLVPLSVGMFPHIFQHWLSAKSSSSFKLPVIAYPLCVAAVWIPSVLVGVIAAGDLPGLTGPEASGVLVAMIGRHAPAALAGLLTAGVFAAIMSSLDSQVLSLSTLFTQDVVGRRFPGLSERRQVLLGRGFVFGLLLVTYLISLLTPPTIFRLGVWCFSGYAALLPVVVAALYWRRSTATGALAAVITVAVSWVLLYLRGGSVAGYTVGGSGVMPVAVMLAASTVALVVGSLLTAPPPREQVDPFFPSGSGAGRSSGGAG
jgi:SSS family solute:Na+ symporter